MPKFRYAKPAPIKWYGFFQRPSCGANIAVASLFIAGMAPVVHTNIILITTKLYLPWRFDLYQRPSSEKAVQFFFRFLWRGKKSVVCVAQCIAALVPVRSFPMCTASLIHRLPTVARTGRRSEELLLTKVSDGDWNVNVNKVWLWLI